MKDAFKRLLKIVGFIGVIIGLSIAGIIGKEVANLFFNKKATTTSELSWQQTIFNSISIELPGKLIQKSIDLSKSPDVMRSISETKTGMLTINNIKFVVSYVIYNNNIDPNLDNATLNAIQALSRTANLSNPKYSIENTSIENRPARIVALKLDNNDNLCLSGITIKDNKTIYSIQIYHTCNNPDISVLIDKTVNSIHFE